MSSKLDQSIDDLDSLQQKLDEAAESLARLRTLAHRARARRWDMLCSPVSALPPEVLSDIFLRVVAQSSKSILNILLVSTWWNEVATNREALWTHLFIPTNHLDLFHHPLTLSGRSPLLIELEVGETALWNTVHSSYPRDLGISERLTSLTLRCPAGSRYSGLDILIDDLKTGLRGLTTFTIISSPSPPLQTNLHVDFPMPKLQRLGMKRAIITLSGNGPIPLKYLTINDAAMTETSFRDLIAHFPSLSTMHLSQLTCRPVFFDDAPPRLVTALEQLRLSAMHPTHAATVLNNITVTNLRTLSIATDLSMAEGSDNNIGLRLAECPRLEELELRGSPSFLWRILYGTGENNWDPSCLSSLTILPNFHKEQSSNIGPHLADTRSVKIIIDRVLDIRLRKQCSPLRLMCTYSCMFPNRRSLQNCALEIKLLDCPFCGDE